MALSWLPIIGPVCERLFKGTKDIVETRKNLVETDKAKLEVEKLEDERDERQSEIQRPSLEDVKKYDPKFRELEHAIRTRSYHIFVGAGFEQRAYRIQHGWLKRTLMLLLSPIIPKYRRERRLLKQQKMLERLVKDTGAQLKRRLWAEPDNPSGDARHE